MVTAEQAGIGPRSPSFFWWKWGFYLYLDTWIAAAAGPDLSRRYGQVAWLKLFPQSLPTDEGQEIWAVLTVALRWGAGRPRLTWTSQADAITTWLIGRGG